MTTTTAPDVDRKRTDAGDDLYHWYCCDPDRALCGADISDFEDSDPGEDEAICVVCDDLADLECRACGWCPE